MDWSAVPSIVLADVDDWLQLLVPAVFVIIWVLSQVLGGGGAQKQPRQPRAPGKQGGQGKLADEIQSFLRRVQQQQQGGGRAALDDEFDEPFQEAEPQVVEAEIVQPRALADGQRQVAGRDLEQVDERFSQRSSSLGSRVGQADEKMEHHMHEVFEHQVGSLTDTSDAIHERTKVKGEQSLGEVPRAAQEIRNMLADPDDVKKAIVLSEVLNRPEHRW